EGKGQKAHVDFLEKKGEFKSNDNSSEQNFPKNKYRCVADKTIWYMDQDRMSFAASDEVREKLKSLNAEDDWETWQGVFLGSSMFVSYMPGQDELSFYAPDATYNYVDYVLTAKNVGVIRVADAAIFPKGDIVIRENAAMDSLKDAKITANVTSEYLKFFGANINIAGKRNYSGNGDYTYINETKEPQNIHFGNIFVAEGETRATGEIGDFDDFKITKHFSYQGKVNAYAGTDSLEYIGAAKINYECDTTNQWFQFKSFVSPEAPFIPIGKDIKSINNMVLCASVMYGNNRIYPAFIEKRRGSTDEHIFRTMGHLHHNDETGKFEIASIEKLNEPNLPGNYMSIDPASCSIYGEGRFGFSSAFITTFNLNSFGQFTYDRESDTVDFNTTMFINMPMPSNVYEYIAKSLANSTDYVDESSEAYHIALKHFLDTTEYSKYMTNISFGNYDKLPKMLTENKIVLTDLHLIFDKKSQTKGFTTGGPIGVVNVGKHRVSKYVAGYLRITKKKGSEIFELLLEPSDETWFYFKYDNGVMSTISSEAKYNDAISNSKEKPLDNYVLVFASTADKNKFKKDMDKKYQNNSEEY
ncbi:MAG: hypothetical protein HUK15_02210, partial [Bacteroidales bacterium]|nr:hypothetical protein [Bacteroidales bacterium]